VHGGSITRLHRDRNLRVIDAREVAGTGGLMFFGLERERVRVHTRRVAASVVVVGLHLVEVLTGLLLEAILAVEHQLEGVEGTNGILVVGLGGGTGTELHQGDTSSRGDGHVAVTRGDGVRLEHNIVDLVLGGEVPQRRTSGGVGEAPHQFLDGVVVRQTHLLGLSRRNSVSTSVLHLLDQVFVTLLGESATLFGVQVDVVGPHLEGVGVTVGREIGRQVDVNADLMVLQGNQRQEQTGVAVEEEEEGKEDLLTRDTSGHLGVGRLLGLIVVEGIVHAPPLLVLLVDALTTDGQFNVVDGTLGDPVTVIGYVFGRGVGGERLEFNVHITDQITVTGDSHRHATGVGGSTVDGLLDVLHREVSVALVNRLKESYLRVTGKVDVLSAISYELHETTSHFESCCSIHRENNSGQTRIF